MDKAYDVNDIFAEMEQEVVASYRRNMARHAAEEIKEGFKWEMWQSAKLRDLANYKKEVRKIVDKHVSRAKQVSKENLNNSIIKGAEYSDIMLKGLSKEVPSIDSFFKANRNKVDALIDAVNNDFTKAGQAALRLSNDKFLQIIFKTEVKFSAGATSLQQAIDMAAKDFLSQGINCIQYKNGKLVNIASYAEMCLRTSAKKAYLTGEGARQAEWGEYLAQVTSYGGCSPTCLPWQGRVYINDVYAGGTSKDGKYPLLSFAMSGGLFHPNCRHTYQPYFEGISELPKQEKTDEEINETYKAEQKQRGIERNIRKYKRIEEGCLYSPYQEKASQKVKEWQQIMRDHLKENPFLTRKPYREKTYGIPPRPGEIKSLAKENLRVSKKEPMPESMKTSLYTQGMDKQKKWL